MTLHNDDSSWICGLMGENSDALGFIPKPTVTHQYVRLGRSILQRDTKGRRVGYLLHGSISQGGPVSIAQACIQYEKRLLDFGTQVVDTLIQRAEHQQASSIRLRCAEELEALRFWQQLGFRIEHWLDVDNRRNRRIAVLSRPLVLGLFGTDDDDG